MYKFICIYALFPYVTQGKLLIRIYVLKKTQCQKKFEIQEWDWGNIRTQVFQDMSPYQLLLSYLDFATYLSLRFPLVHIYDSHGPQGKTYHSLKESWLFLALFKIIIIDIVDLQCY